MTSAIGSMPTIDPTLLQQKLTKRLDANGDGAISADELSALQSKAGPAAAVDTATAFQSADADGDGLLSEGEAKTAFQQIADQLRSLLLEAQEKFGPGGGQGPGSGQGPGGGDPAAFLQRLFATLDADGSGALSAEEFDGQSLPGGATLDLASLFDAADGDGDGQLSAEEASGAFRQVHDALVAKLGAPPPPPPPPGGSTGEGSGSATGDEAQAADATASEESAQELLKQLVELLLRQQNGQATDTQSALVSTLQALGSYKPVDVLA